MAGFAAAIISQPADTLLSKINKTKALPGETVTSRLIKMGGQLGVKGLFTGLGARSVLPFVRTNTIQTLILSMIIVSSWSVLSLQVNSRFTETSSVCSEQLEALKSQRSQRRKFLLINFLVLRLAHEQLEIPRIDDYRTFIFLMNLDGGISCHIPICSSLAFLLYIFIYTSGMISVLAFEQKKRSRILTSWDSQGSGFAVTHGLKLLQCHSLNNLASPPSVPGSLGLPLQPKFFESDTTFSQLPIHNDLGLTHSLFTLN
jgi:hypothetical protein